MNVVPFNNQKHRKDRFIEEIYRQMDKVQKIEKSQCNDNYYKELMILDKMIAEAKKKNLKVDSLTLYQKIIYSVDTEL